MQIRGRYLWHCSEISGQKLSWNWYLTHVVEFRWSPEGPVSQIHSPHLLVGAPGIFSELLRFVHMLKRQWGAESNGSYRAFSSLVKLQPRFLSLQWKICLCAELQLWCLRLEWRTCPWAEHWWWWWWCSEIWDSIFLISNFHIFQVTLIKF